MGTPTANNPFGRYFDFVNRLQGDDTPNVGSVVATFDSLLAALNKVVPVAGQVALVRTGVNASLEKMKVLSEIERQLFLQFLEGEIAYLRGHLIMKASDLYRKLQHDRDICERKQAQISAMLIRMFNVEGIDSGFYSALAAQRIETFKTFIAMKLTPKEATMTSTYADDFLNNRETAAVRKIMEQLLDFYSDEDSPRDFHAHDAWLELKRRWHEWASKHRERMATFKELWTTGGGKDTDRNPQASEIISDYYHELYAQIEHGNFSLVLSQYINFDSWN